MGDPFQKGGRPQWVGVQCSVVFQRSQLCGGGTHPGRQRLARCPDDQQLGGGGQNPLGEL